MEEKHLDYTVRKESGKGAARQIRREGLIPAILYGTEAPKMIAVNEREFLNGFRNVSENTIIDLKSGKEHHKVFVKAMQSDIISETVKHIDFYEIEKGKKLKLHIPIHLEGTAVGVKRDGGILEQKLEEIEVECLPDDIPEVINIDISTMELNSSLHVSDIPQLKGVKVTTDSHITIVLVSPPKDMVLTDSSEEGEEGTEEEGATE